MGKRDKRTKKAPHSSDNESSEGEFVVEKVVDRRVKDGEVSASNENCIDAARNQYQLFGTGSIFAQMEKLSGLRQHLGAGDQSRVSGFDQKVRDKSQEEDRRRK